MMTENSLVKYIKSAIFLSIIGLSWWKVPEYAPPDVPTFVITVGVIAVISIFLFGSGIAQGLSGVLTTVIYAFYAGNSIKNQLKDIGIGEAELQYLQDQGIKNGEIATAAFYYQEQHGSVDGLTVAMLKELVLKERAEERRAEDESVDLEADLLALQQASEDAEKFLAQLAARPQQGESTKEVDVAAGGRKLSHDE